MIEKRIGIVGMGVVGSATAKMFKTLGHDICSYDKDKTKWLDHGWAGQYSFMDHIIKTRDAIFLCLPTESTKKGIDISIVDSVCKELSAKHYKGLVVIKSTVIPGTCEKLMKKYDLNIAHNPEFLTAVNPFADSLHPDKIVVGIENSDLDSMQLLINLYNHPIFKGVKMIVCPLKTAEMIKYACNCELAMQVSFANELYDLCKKKDICYEAVEEAMKYDKRIGTFKRVNPKDRGYGGMCFPKDTWAFWKWSKSKMIEATIKVNKKVRGITFKDKEVKK